MVSSIRKSSSRAFTFARLAAAVALFAGAETLRADLNANISPKSKKQSRQTGVVIPTALAEAVVAEVDRGSEITLRLRGIASGGGQVEFRLLQKPRFGKITKSHPLGLDTLEVVYRHSGERRGSSDTFVFGVRAGRVGPFSPGEATIQIKDVPGRLLAPEALEFPSVLAGETATDSFLLANDGGAPLSGTIAATPPWEIAPPLAYSLQPGQKRKIIVLFRPDRGGAYRGRINFEGDERASIELTGRGTIPFSASPSSLTLLPDAATGKRTATVFLQNTSSNPLEIQVATELPIEKSLTLKFGETREFLIEDNGGPALASQIVFSSGAYTTQVAVDAPATRPFNIATPSPTSVLPEPDPVAPEPSAPLATEILPDPTPASAPPVIRLPRPRPAHTQPASTWTLARTRWLLFVLAVGLVGFIFQKRWKPRSKP